MDKTEYKREIKFRAWNIGSEEMWDCDQLALNRIHLSVSGNEFLTHDEDGALELLPYLKPMQFTGLRDKNGVEIYEGDVMSFLGENWTVIYFEQYASFMLQNGNDLANITTQEEVIGNRYQNKSLIS
jgi:uncharacterized phage protein (TIGR01671 family)